MTSRSESVAVPTPIASSIRQSSASPGGFDIILDDGAGRLRVTLFQPWRALYVPSLLWTDQVNFYGGTVGLVLASDFFDEEDYIRDYDEYIRVVQAR